MRARLVHGRLSAVREGPRNARIPRASVLRLLVFPDGNCKLRGGGGERECAVPLLLLCGRDRGRGLEPTVACALVFVLCLKPALCCGEPVFIFPREYAFGLFGDVAVAILNGVSAAIRGVLLPLLLIY